MRTRGWAGLPEDVGINVLAGYLGTKAMEPVSMALYQKEPETARAKEDAARPGPPYRIAAAKTANLLGLKLSDTQLDQAALLFHYGLAVSWSPVYALVRRQLRMHPIPAGLGMGTTMSLIADELMTPAFGFSAPNRDYPLATHLRGYAAHLAFGLAVATVTEAAWCLTRHRRS